MLATLVFLSFLEGAFGQANVVRPAWHRLPVDWPDTTNQVRSMVVSQDELYIGVGGMVPQSAQVWKLAGSQWVKHVELPSSKIAALQADAKGNLFLGAGTAHSAEVVGKGQAEVWRVDPSGSKTRLRAFPERDVAYSMVWFQSKLHVGTMTEDRPGTAEIWRFDDPGWTQVAGAGIHGWPQDKTYAAAYELWVHDGSLIAGTFSRTLGDGDVLKLDSDRWVDLQAPPTLIALSFASHRGQLVAGLSNVGSRLANPIVVLQADGSWQPLGQAPEEWKLAHIFNHLIVHGNELYLGVGGARGTLSAWKYDGANWIKLGGDGRSGSWVSPVVRSGHEWIYRMAIHQGKLYTGLASDRVPFAAPVWQLTP
jgi:hypothetical protein